MVPSSPLSVTFADLLRHHRVLARLTQQELAERARLSVDAISSLERGARRRPRKDTVALLAEALALPPAEHATFAAVARRPPVAALAASPPKGATASAPLDSHTVVSAIFAPTNDVARGSITFHVADVDGSVRLLHHFGDHNAKVLAAIHALLGTIWVTQDGHVLGTQRERQPPLLPAPDAIGHSG